MASLSLYLASGAGPLPRGLGNDLIFMFWIIWKDCLHPGPQRPHTARPGEVQTREDLNSCKLPAQATKGMKQVSHDHVLIPNSVGESLHVMLLESWNKKCPPTIYPRREHSYKKTTLVMFSDSGFKADLRLGVLCISQVLQLTDMANIHFLVPLFAPSVEYTMRTFLPCVCVCVLCCVLPSWEGQEELLK